MRRCRSATGWMNFTAKRGETVKRVDVMPVTINGEIPLPHCLGADCPCHPRVDYRGSAPLIVHDHPWSVPQ